MHRGPVARSMQEATLETGSEPFLAELVRLENEVAYLVDVTGASVETADASRSVAERLSSLTEAVSKSAAQLSNEQRGSRAA